MYLTRPLILKTKEDCIQYNGKVNGISLKRYIEGYYKLPAIVYSDSGYYGCDENYLHTTISELSERRKEEIRKYLEI